jgi:hypothetical protein
MRNKVNLANLKMIAILRLAFGLSLSILLVNCNNRADNKAAQADTVKNEVVDQQQSGTEKINWLQDHQNRWDTIPFVSRPDDTRGIDTEMTLLRVYVRGWLAEYNAEIKAINPDTVQYVVDSFNFEMKTRSPLRYRIQAFLKPPVRHPHHEGPGTHLIPPEPPPPRKT